MNFKDFLIESTLLEGGKALQGVQPIAQIAIRAALPDLIKAVSKALNGAKVKVVGSAGKKNDAETSGDVDLAVEATPKAAEAAARSLSDNHRSMPGVNVYSFAWKFGDALGQVDLMPVTNSDYSEWGMFANPNDLAKGLKSAHRNELLYAVARYANRIEKNEGDQLVEVERYFYDPARGLYRGTQRCVSPAGKPLKNPVTTEKHLEVTDPVKATTILFGPGIRPEDVTSYEGALAAIKKSSFPHKKYRDEILAMARDGLKGKGLSEPQA